MSGKTIVVVGGGFGGFYALKTLSGLGLTERNRVVLVDKSRRFVYLPSLPYLISGKKTVEDLTEPLEEIAKRLGAEFLLGEVTRVSLQEKTIELSNGEKLRYDYLVLAAGATTEYYGIPGAHQALPAWRLEDYERIVRELGKCGSGCRVCIAGGGLTGVEVAGEVAEKYEGKSEVVVVEKMQMLMPTLNSQRASKIIEEFLSSKGVRIIKGNGVSSVSEKNLNLEDGTSIQCDIVVWTVGVRPPDIRFDVDVPVKGRGWICVKPTLQVVGRDDVYAIGDINHFAVDSDYAMKMAEEAILQGKTAAKNIALQVSGEAPRYTHKPIFLASKPKSLVSVGYGRALMIWENKILFGRAPYISKMLIESIVMRDVKGKVGGGIATSLESKILRTISG